MTDARNKDAGHPGAPEAVRATADTGLTRRAEDGISLREVLRVLWRGKWLVTAVTAAFAVASVAYALLATEIYRAEVLLAPAKEQSAPVIGGQLGGLAALAGVNISEGNSVESLAVLRSREFARDFITELQLMPVFFQDIWDAERKEWLTDDPDEVPDIRDGVKFFHEQVLRIGEDRTTGLVTLAVEWTDPDVAAQWAGMLAERLNNRLRERAQQDAQTNVDYLRSELARTALVPMQESIGRLLETELQKLMLARGNAEFAFKIVDPAVAPKQRARPKRALIAIIGTFLGGLVGLFAVLALHLGRAGPDR
jgi:uncharacterized protein involved in exopolysaccharide biosynthesis